MQVLQAIRTHSCSPVASLTGTVLGGWRLRTWRRLPTWSPTMCHVSFCPCSPALVKPAGHPQMCFAPVSAQQTQQSDPFKTAAPQRAGMFLIGFEIFLVLATGSGCRKETWNLVSLRWTESLISTEGRCLVVTTFPGDLPTCLLLLAAQSSNNQTMLVDRQVVCICRFAAVLQSLVQA